jgi:hypothetical protein
MVRVEGVIDIRQRPEVVFDTVADERSVYDPNVIRAEMLTDGPLGVGTRFRSVVQGRRAPVETLVTITGFDRPRRLRTTTVAKGIEIASDIGLSAIPAGAHVRWSCDVRPSGPLRLLGPILGIVAKRQTARVWEALRAELERRPALAAVGVQSAVP